MMTETIQGIISGKSTVQQRIKSLAELSSCKNQINASTVINQSRRSLVDTPPPTSKPKTRTIQSLPPNRPAPLPPSPTQESSTARINSKEDSQKLSKRADSESHISHSAFQSISRADGSKIPSLTNILSDLKPSKFNESITIPSSTVNDSKKIQIDTVDILPTPQSTTLPELPKIKSENSIRETKGSAVLSSPALPALETNGSTDIIKTIIDSEKLPLLSDLSKSDIHQVKLKFRNLSDLVHANKADSTQLNEYKKLKRIIKSNL